MFQIPYLLHVLVGFFFGSICPTAFALISPFILWNNFMVLCIVLILEQRSTRLMQFFKVGFLFGLFVDAFKVGS